MPYLRFSRDEHGYENTYVLHTYRRGDRSQRRLLYWFRTPPNVKVGRLPLNEDAIRAVEENNPDLAFDWSKILKVKPARGTATRGKQTSSVTARKKRGQSSGRKQEAARRDRIPAPCPTGKAQDSISSGNGEGLRVSEVPSAAPVSVEPDSSAPERAGEESEGVSSEAMFLEEDLRSDSDGGDVEGLAGVELHGEHPVVTLMGDETLARMRATYAEIQVRIAEKFNEPSEGQEIRVRSEGLNPDRWKTVEQAVRGIETFKVEADAIRARAGRTANEQ